MTPRNVSHKMTSKAELLKQYLTPLDSSANSEYLQPKSKKKKKKKVSMSAGGMKVVDLDALSTVASTGSQKNTDEIDEDDEPIIVTDPDLAAELELEQIKQRALKEAGEGGWVTIDSSVSSSQQNDVSPPRRSRKDDGDASPPRRSRKDDGDISPPRRSRKDDDISPPRRSHKDDGDTSPPRRSRKDDDDTSPSRSSRKGDGQECPQKRKIERIDNSSSNERKLEDELAKLSEPPLKRIKQEHDSGSTKTSERRRAGLLTAEEIAQEANEKKKAEEQRFAMRSPSELGKGAKTVYRDRHGRPLEMLTQFLNQEKGVYIDDEDANMEWGRGYVDPKEKEEQKQRTDEEKGRPYRGRTMEDAELNEEWREKDRWGDPMASFLNKEKARKKTKKESLSGTMASQPLQYPTCSCLGRCRPFKWLRTKLFLASQ